METVVKKRTGPGFLPPRGIFMLFSLFLVESLSRLSRDSVESRDKYIDSSVVRWPELAESIH